MNLNTTGILALVGKANRKSETHTHTHTLLHLTATGSLKLTKCWFPRMWLELIYPGIPDKLWSFPPFQFSAIEFLKLLASEFHSLIGGSKNRNHIANKLEIHCQRIPQFKWNIKVKNHIANKFRRKIVTFINCHPNLATVPETCFTAIPGDSISSGYPHCQITHLTAEN